MSLENIYGCMNWNTKQIEFYQDSCIYYGCMNWETSQVEIPISTANCNDIYYGCMNWNTGSFEAIIPDDCCEGAGSSSSSSSNSSSSSSSNSSSSSSLSSSSSSSLSSSSSSDTPAPECGTGLGTAESPFIVCTIEQLQDINEEGDGVWGDGSLAAYYKLGQDIGFNPSESWDYGDGGGFMPIGDDTTEFTGEFDGDGYIIDGLYINRPSMNDVGLFGKVSEIGQTGTVKNVGLTNVDINGNNQVGALVGHVDTNGTVENCYSTGTVYGNNYVGGLVGLLETTNTTEYCYSTCNVTGVTGEAGGLIGKEGSDGPVINCYATGDVSGGYQLGGFVGNGSHKIEQCYATGNVNGTDNLGGFIGLAEFTNTDIKNCYAQGDVNGNDSIGGFVGQKDKLFTNCYSTGSATGVSQVGGFLGNDDGGTEISCYWDMDTSGNPTSAGDATGKGTSDMYKKATFVDWNFGDDEPSAAVWYIFEDEDYPRLLGLENPSNF